jgi:hypothetical protein
VGRILPFSGTPGEKAEIRNLFRVLSSGGDPNGHPELKGVYRKHKILFDIFDICVDVRYGNFLHLPFPGSVLEQGAKTMDMLKYIQYLYRQKIAEEEKKHYGSSR